MQRRAHGSWAGVVRENWPADTTSGPESRTIRLDEQAVDSMPTKSEFVTCAHSFRAIAVMAVVAVHVLDRLHFGEGRDWEGKILRACVHNGTALFVFVAGFLFQHLSRRFDYRRYLARKGTTIFLPYLCYSVPTLLFEYVTRTVIFAPPSGLPDESYLVAAVDSVVLRALLSLVTGEHMIVPFWYMSFIGTIYLAAPLWIWLDRHPRYYWSLLPLTIVAVFIHRPANPAAIWHVLPYYLPVYLVGMACSHYREAVLGWVRPRSRVLWLTFVGLMLVEVLCLGQYGALFSRRPFSTEHGVVDLNLISRLLLCPLLLVELERHEARMSPLMDRLARLSYGIFLMHRYIIVAVVRVLGKLAPPTLTWGAFSLVSVTALCIAISVGVLFVAQRMMGRFSRHIFGA